jgi:hypothetical protein
LHPLIGALVGAISALAGVLLTLRHNQRIHQERLAEDRRVARDEREFLAKQDALMSASEASAGEQRSQQSRIGSR